MLSDLSVDGVADHGLDVVVRQHLLHDVRQQPERVLLLLDEQQQRRRHKVHALAVGHLRVALRVGEEDPAQLLDELGCQPRVLGKCSSHVQLDGVTHLGRRGRRDEPLVQPGLSISPGLCSAQEHPCMGTMLVWDAFGDRRDEFGWQRPARAVLFAARLPEELRPISLAVLVCENAPSLHAVEFGLQIDRHQEPV